MTISHYISPEQNVPVRVKHSVVLGTAINDLGEVIEYPSSPIKTLPGDSARLLGYNTHLALISKHGQYGICSFENIELTGCSALYYPELTKLWS